jgi:hypothetical protein
MSDEPRWVRVWPEYAKAVTSKLEAGFEEHTDESFARTPEELIGELMQEASDFGGWGMVFWNRMRCCLGHLETLRMEFAALQQAQEKVHVDIDQLNRLRDRLENEVIVLKKEREKLR